jgi:cell division protein ZapA
MADNADNKFQIHLTIAGKRYQLNIDRNDEELYRRAEREINEVVAQYKGAFRCEVEDHLALAALQIAVRFVSLENSRSLSEELDTLREMSRRLGDELRDMR